MGPDGLDFAFAADAPGRVRMAPRGVRMAVSSTNVESGKRRSASRIVSARPHSLQRFAIARCCSRTSVELGPAIIHGREAGIEIATGNADDGAREQAQALQTHHFTRRMNGSLPAEISGEDFPIPYLSYSLFS